MQLVLCRVVSNNNSKHSKQAMLAVARK